MESSLPPPALSIADNRNFVMSFSDYVANTLFESLYAEHIGWTQVEIPGIKTLFDKQCLMCHIVIAVKLAAKDDVQARARLWNARKAFVIGAVSIPVSLDCISLVLSQSRPHFRPGLIQILLVICINR